MQDTLDVSFLCLDNEFFASEYVPASKVSAELKIACLHGADRTARSWDLWTPIT